MAAAEALDVSVDDPRADPASVWSQAGTYPANLALTFTLQPDATILDVFMSPALGDYSSWSFPVPFLQNLEDRAELVFVEEKDGCRCKTMWRVAPSSGGHTLLELEKEICGCCQSLAVPVAGDVLDYSQQWIPAAYVAQHVRARNASDTGRERLLSVAKCRTMGGGVQIKKTSVLQAAQRELNGYFTWLISSSRIDEIYTKLQEICEGSCGPKKDVLLRPQVTTHKACEMAAVSIEDVIYTLKEAGTDGFDAPGCVTVSGCAAQKPWYQLTCGAQTCEGSGRIQVYCNTLNNLETLANSLTTYLYPASHVSDCGLPCSATRTNRLVQCTRESFYAFGTLPVTYEAGDSLPDGVEIIDEAFEVDQCSLPVCYTPDVFNLVARLTKGYFRIFILRLTEALRIGAYAQWQAQHATTPNKLWCRAYWRFFNSDVAPYFSAWQGEGVAKGIYFERLPVVPFPYFTSIPPVKRTLCIPWAGDYREEGDSELGYIEFTSIAGKVNTCGNVLEGYPDFEDTLGTAIEMGYQLTAGDVELEVGYDSNDYDAFDCAAQSGFSSQGTSVTYEGSPYVSWHSNETTYFTILEIACFCPTQQGSASGMHSGGLTGCLSMLFDAECS